jgi:hypothetical protein
VPERACRRTGAPFLIHYTRAWTVCLARGRTVHLYCAIGASAKHGAFTPCVDVRQLSLFGGTAARFLWARPADVPAGALGPRLAAAIATLSGRNRISRRDLVELVEELFGCSLSTGTVEAILTRTAAAVEPVYEHLLAHIRRAHAVNVDEPRCLDLRLVEGDAGYVAGVTALVGTGEEREGAVVLDPPGRRAARLKLFLVEGGRSTRAREEREAEFGRGEVEVSRDRLATAEGDLRRVLRIVTRGSDKIGADRAPAVRRVAEPKGIGLRLEPCRRWAVGERRAYGRSGTCRWFGGCRRWRRLTVGSRAGPGIAAAAACKESGEGENDQAAHLVQDTPQLTQRSRDPGGVGDAALL